MEKEELQKEIHLKGLSYSKNAKECGDLTVVPLGYVDKIINEIIEIIDEHITIEQRTHRIGSHSDDYGGYSDELCDCDESDRNLKIEALKSVKNRIINYIKQPKNER